LSLDGRGPSPQVGSQIRIYHHMNHPEKLRYGSPEKPTLWTILVSGVALFAFSVRYHSRRKTVAK
jgi:hypothetical protein